MTEQTPAYISKSGMIQTHPGCPNYKVIQNADTPAKQAKVGAMEITQADARQRITSGKNKQCGMCAKIEAKVAAGSETVSIPGLGEVSKQGIEAPKAAGAEPKAANETLSAKKPARKTSPRKTPIQKLEEAENAAKAKAAKTAAAAAAKATKRTPAKSTPKATVTKAGAKKAVAPKAPKKSTEVADKPYKSAFLVNGEVVSMAAARRWAQAVNGETYGAYVPRTVRAAYAAAKAAGYVDVEPKADAK